MTKKNRRPFLKDQCKHTFARIRNAVATKCPSLAKFHDQDLRDTSVTWLALADCTVPQISSITGHSEQSAHSILKHYLGRDPELAASAIGKLVSWLEAKGAEL